MRFNFLSLSRWRRARGPTSEIDVPRAHGRPIAITFEVMSAERRGSSVQRTIARLVLGTFLLYAGTAHLSFARHTFQAQVPAWLPLNADFVVLASGVAEIALGGALLLLARSRVSLGWLVAAFFVLVFPGNINQFLTHADAFGLNSDQARAIRLLFQPLLVVWALWCTGAWASVPTAAPSRSREGPQFRSDGRGCHRRCRAAPTRSCR